MTPQPIDPKSLSLTQLREIGFNLHEQEEKLAIDIKQVRQGIDIIRAEIASRPSEPQATVEVPKEAVEGEK